MQRVHPICKLTLNIMLLLTLVSLTWAQNRPSEQKTGSVLVFPYYTSNLSTTADTLMSISNLSPSSVRAHLYFMEGSTCTQADYTVFLTPNATLTLQASYDIPFETGYLIVVAIDQNGCVATNGGLSGNAFVKAPAGYFGAGSGETRGNYGALAFQAYAPICPVGGEAALTFDGVALDAMPSSFAAAVQNPTVAPGQTLVLAGLNGNVASGTITGGSQIGSGGAYNANEAFRSFSPFIFGGCQGIATITNATPRIIGVSTLGLSGLIPAGTVGVLRINTAGSAGLLITPQNNSGWSGIRLLPFTRTSNVTLRVPVF